MGQECGLLGRSGDSRRLCHRRSLCWESPSLPSRLTLALALVDSCLAGSRAALRARRSLCESSLKILPLAALPGAALGAGRGRGDGSSSCCCNSNSNSSSSSRRNSNSSSSGGGGGGGGGEGLATGEFCCLFWGYDSRCASCPLPRAVQDLFDGAGGPGPRGFRPFGKRQAWERWRAQQGDALPPGSGRDLGTVMAQALSVLGLDEEPRTVTQLKRAFKAAAKRHHPDLGGTEEGFRRLVTAYETAMSLLRPGRRSRPVP